MINYGEYKESKRNPSITFLDYSQQDKQKHGSDAQYPAALEWTEDAKNYQEDKHFNVQSKFETCEEKNFIKEMKKLDISILGVSVTTGLVLDSVELGIMHFEFVTTLHIMEMEYDSFTEH